MSYLCNMKICNKCGLEKDLKYFGETTAKGRFYKHSACKQCRNKVLYLKRLQDPEKERLRKRKQKLKREYNMTLEDYDNMYSAQEGRCRICGIYQDLLNIDHCHSTNKVRGLLCFACNTALGAFKDNSGILGRAILYLKETNTDKSE